MTTSAPDPDENPTPPKLPTGIAFVSVTGFTPAFVAVTLIVTVQFAFAIPAGAAGSEPPLTVKNASPASGTGVKASPGQFVPVVTGAATRMVPGNMSVNAMPASGVALKLRTVTVSVDVPPVVIGVGANAFSTRAPVCSRTFAENAVLPTPCAVVSAFAAIEFVTLPST